jgi:CheY-like chemotaxis protein
MHVLLVDDNSGDILLLREAMDHVGMKRTCRAVRTGQEAVSYLLQQTPYEDAPRPDLIVMDLRLPVMDGFEVMKEFHHRPGYRKIPLVIMTGMARDGGDCCDYWDKDRCLYLVKPMSFTGYVDAVRAIQEFLASLCPAAEG